MKRLALIPTALIPALFLLGCGSSTPSGQTTSPTPNPNAALSGNWEAVVSLAPGSVALPMPIADLFGSLQFSGSTVTGTLRAFAPNAISASPNCPSYNTDLPVTGTLDAGRTLTLSIPLSGGTGTLTASIPQNTHAFLPGSLVVVGGTCPIAATPITLSQYASATGTFAGTFNQLDTGDPATIVPGTATAITAVLTQAATPNVDGQFPLSGTVTATGACTGIFTFTDGVIFGNGILSHPFPGSTSPTGDFTGAIDPTAATFRGAISFFAACGYHTYQGSLTRQ